MALVDLHVHSKYSDHPSEWFLQRIGAQESYTEPEYIYRLAKKAGMQFVTITDHNSIGGALLLKENHPEDSFIGVETTSYFPEDGCKVHILIFDIDEARFADIQKIRNNIYELRDYIRDNGIVYSVAHATYSINKRLTVDHLEKLLLLFDVFETINGGRSRANNRPWEIILKNISPSIIESLRERYEIDPFGDTPWIKGLTGGSDDHAGLFIGQTYTVAQASRVDDFLLNLRNKLSISEGRCNTYQSLAFSIYKIAYDYSRTKSNGLSESLFSQLTERLFESKKPSFGKRFKIKSWKMISGGESTVNDRYCDLFNSVSDSDGIPFDEKFDQFYDKLSGITDEFFKGLMVSLEKGIHQGDIPKIIRNITSSMTGIFLTMPFYSTLGHFSRGKHITDVLSKRLFKTTQTKSKKILWFTDTITDLNGVSMIVKKVGWLSYFRGKEVTVVTSIPAHLIDQGIPPTVVNLPALHEFEMPYYSDYTLRIPSFLSSLKMLAEFEPDEVFISTPGPIGLFGLLMGRIMNAKCVGVYHTDFTMQAREIIADESIDDLLESSVRWFYSMMDEIRVPTKEYIRILENRDYDPLKMKVFRRGIDTAVFSPRSNGSHIFKSKYGAGQKSILMYAGRISKDKNLDFLVDVFKGVRTRYPDTALFLVGDGPYMGSMISQCADDSGVFFTGRLERDMLPELYSGADLFAFPSLTDTFGMVVIEAQSCGLPAIVSNVGGPQELIIDGETGFVVPTADKNLWVEKISAILDLKEQHPELYASMRYNSRRNVVENSDWELVLQEITEEALPV